MVEFTTRLTHIESKDKKNYKEYEFTSKSTHYNIGNNLGRDMEFLEDVIEEEMKVLRRKAKLLQRGLLRESNTEILALRVKPTLKQLWQRLPREVKRAARSAVEAVVVAYYLGGHAELNTQPGIQAVGFMQPVIINMNIAEARAENRNNIKIDIDKILDLLEEIMEDIRMMKRLAEYPSERNTRQISRKAEKIIERINEMRRRLEFN